MSQAENDQDNGRICHECMTKQMEQYLDSNITRIVANKDLITVNDDVACALCGKELHERTHWFTMDDFSRLQNTDRGLLREFFRTFDFEVRW